MSYSDQRSLSSVAAKPALPSDGHVQAADECLDDVTFPPGGRPWARGGADPFACAEPPYLDRRGRDLRLDLLRGYFVLAMIVDHVRGPSPLYLLTGGNRFFTSAAEGFILTSGLVTGLVYRRLMDREGLGASLLKLLARAGVLYLLTIGLTLLFLPVSEILNLPWAQGISLANPAALVVSILTLHRTYYLVDVMVLYTALFIVSPLAFILMARGKTRIVLLGSVVLWGLYQLYPDAVALPWPIQGNYLFQFSAWQLLFFVGLILGVHQDRLPVLGCNATRVAVIITGLASAALIVAYFLLDPPTEVMPVSLAFASVVPQDVRLWFQDFVFAKADLRPGRLLASAITFSFLFFATTHFWVWVRRAVGWLLLPLGQQALYAYTVHVGVVAVVALAIAPFNLAYPGPQWLNALIQAASVLLIWAMARWRFLAPTEATRRYWHASPAVLAVLVVAALTWLPLPARPELEQPSAQALDLQARAARRYGTPVPADRSSAQAPLLPASTPEPPSFVGSAPISDGERRIQEWVGEIKGSVREHWFYSRALKREMPYYIYLPPDYDTANRRYPTLYMLHGSGGHREEWLAYFLIDIADQQISAGRLAPMIIVLPQGDSSYWANYAGDGPRWGDYLNKDLVTHIDASYRTLRSRQARGIGGLSRGGWGALHQAFTRPDIFGVVGAHSPSLQLDDTVRMLLGDEEEFARKDPVSLARSASSPVTLQIWIDIGAADRWLEPAVQLHEILQQRGIEHFWQLYPGEHDYRYWRAHVLDYLRFYGTALTRR